MNYKMVCNSCGTIFERQKARKYCPDCYDSVITKNATRRIEFIKEHQDLTITQLADLLGVARVTVYSDIEKSGDPNLQHLIFRRPCDRPWTTSEIAALPRHADNGLCISETAATMGRSYSSVRYHARAQGIEFVHGNSRKGDRNYAHI